MSGSRRVVFLSMVVVGLGAVGALGAFFLDPARAAVGPLPAEGLLLPADARFVVGLDVKRFTASPLYKKFAAQARPDAFRDLEEKTGLNLERDVDQVLIAGRAAGGSVPGVAIVLGSFDTYKLGRAIETNPKAPVGGRAFLGYTEYVFNEAGKEPGAVAFLDRQALVIGTEAAVEAALTAKAQGATPLRTNPSIMGLLERVKPGSTVWMVGDQSLLQNLPATIPAPGGGGSGNSIALPALKSLIITGDLDPMVALSITGDTPDEAAARNLGDIVRGFVALASLQANQRPEFKDLASAISVTTEASRVQVNARIPYAMLDAFQPKKAAVAPPAIAQ
jgi:hypothetical protein